MSASVSHAEVDPRLGHGVDEARTFQVGADESCPFEVGSLEIGAESHVPSRRASGESGVFRIGVLQVGDLSLSTDERGVRETRASKIRARDRRRRNAPCGIGAGKIGMFKLEIE
jgi:hypothetical protein